MMKLAISVVDLDAPSKGFAELHLGTGEAEAFWLGRDLETATVPLHDIIIADDAFVDETKDASCPTTIVAWGPHAKPFPFLEVRLVILKMANQDKREMTTQY